MHQKDGMLQQMQHKKHQQKIAKQKLTAKAATDNVICISNKDRQSKKR